MDASPVPSAPDPATSSGFGVRLQAAVAARRSQLVLGLDPDPVRLWPRAIELAGGAGSPPAPAAQRAALAVAIHCALVIESAGEHCVAVKPQVACFERLGAPGWAALSEVIRRAQDYGLLVIADGKRGDIDVSAVAYGQAFFGHTPTPYGAADGLGADALTVNPLLGGDSLAPLVEAARSVSAGLFVLVRTSNPGAADVQGLRVADEEGPAADDRVSDRLAELVDGLGRSQQDQASLADVGAVVGATAPEWIERLRMRMPRAVFLLPGVGAQGGNVEDLTAAFAPGPAGGLISASRSIVDAYKEGGGTPAAAAGAQAERLRELAWSIAT